MTVEELLTIVHKRGLEIVSRGNGQLSIRGPKAEITEALLRVLKIHRPSLLERLGDQDKTDSIAAPELTPNTPAPEEEPPVLHPGAGFTGWITDEDIKKWKQRYHL